jgi:hypothetical protein
MFRQSGHQRIMAAIAALVLMVLDAECFLLDRHIGISSFMKSRKIS